MRKMFFLNVEKMGRYTLQKDKYNFKNYVAVLVNENADLMRVVAAPNFESFTRDGVKYLVGKKWTLKTTTETFELSYNDIIIFNKNWKIVDCLMNGQNKPYESILACNDYIVEQDD